MLRVFKINSLKKSTVYDRNILLTILLSKPYVMAEIRLLGTDVVIYRKPSSPAQQLPLISPVRSFLITSTKRFLMVRGRSIPDLSIFMFVWHVEALVHHAILVFPKGILLPPFPSFFISLMDSNVMRTRKRNGAPARNHIQRQNDLTNKS